MRDSNYHRTARPRRPAGRAGFTLVELLVVIGIIAVLLSILLPMAYKMRRTGERKRTELDLQAISSALEAFKADLHDYPRAGIYPAQDPSPTSITVGSEILGACLIASADKPRANPNKNPDPSFNYWDYERGPGFRLHIGGRTYGPYLAPDKFQMLSGNNLLADRNGTPILYFPARVPVQDPTLPNGYVAIRQTNADGTLVLKSDGTAASDPMYDLTYANVVNNPTPTGVIDSGKYTINPYKMRFMLGDNDMNGQINNIEQATAAGAHYILWATGPDKLFGPDADLSTTSGGPQNTLSNDADRASLLGNATLLAKFRAAAAKCDDVIVTQ